MTASAMSAYREACGVSIRENYMRLAPGGNAASVISWRHAAPFILSPVISLGGESSAAARC